MATKSAAKKADELKISQVGDFKKRIGGIFELPSGLVAKLRNPGGLNAFTSSGTIPNALMNLVADGLTKNKSGQAEAAKILKEDPEALKQMTDMLDAVTIKCFIQPTVHPEPTETDLKVWNAEHPNDQKTSVNELREDHILYVDEVSSNDKQFIFSWITSGVADLERFRNEHQ